MTTQKQRNERTMLNKARYFDQIGKPFYAVTWRGRTFRSEDVAEMARRVREAFPEDFLVTCEKGA